MVPSEAGTISSPRIYEAGTWSVCIIEGVGLDCLPCSWIDSSLLRPAMSGAGAYNLTVTGTVVYRRKKGIKRDKKEQEGIRPLMGTERVDLGVHCHSNVKKKETWTLTSFTSA